MIYNLIAHTHTHKKTKKQKNNRIVSVKTNAITQARQLRQFIKLIRLEVKGNHRVVDHKHITTWSVTNHPVISVT